MVSHICQLLNSNLSRTNTIGPPPSFNWDLVGGDTDPFIDDPESEDYNVDQIVDRFINYAKAYSQIYATNNLLFPMGTDFQYQDANVWFKNMDKLIKYVNQRQAKGSNVNVFYSTPTCYLHGVNMVSLRFILAWSNYNNCFNRRTTHSPQKTMTSFRTRLTLTPIGPDISRLDRRSNAMKK